MKWENSYFLIILSIILTSYSVVNLYIIEPDVDNVLNGMTALISMLSLFIFSINNNRQITESIKNRILQFQPLPTIIDLNAYIDPPICFGKPYEKDGIYIPIFLNRLFILYKIKNNGNSPAISIDIQSIIEHEKIKEGPLENHLNNLKEGDITEKDSFMFVRFINQILEELVHPVYINSPVLTIDIYYKNMLGGCFKISQLYDLFIYEEDMDTIKKWIKDINNAEIDSKDKIALIKRSQDESTKKTLWGEIESNFMSKINEDKIDFFVTPRPGSYKLTSLSEDEYEEKTENMFYGRRVRRPTKVIIPDNR